MTRERGACFVAITGDDVQRAGRQAGLGGEFGHPQHGQAGVLGRFDDARVARRERRTDAAAEDLHRVVPRHDMAGHPVRLAHGEDGIAGLIGKGLAVQLVGGPRVELEIAGQRRGVCARLAQWFAGVARFELGEFFMTRRYQQGQPVQDAPALGCAGGAPGAFEGMPCGTHRGLDIRGGAAGQLRKRLPVGRIEHWNRLAPERGGPFAADEVFRFFHACSWLKRHLAHPQAHLQSRLRLILEARLQRRGFKRGFDDYRADRHGGAIGRLAIMAYSALPAAVPCLIWVRRSNARHVPTSILIRERS